MESAVQPQLEPTFQPKESVRWSLAHRLIFRFLCCYFFLYMAPDPPGRLDLITSLPKTDWLGNAYGGLWHKLVPWVAIHVFHLSGQATTYFPTGSGDTTLDFIENLLFVAFAAVAAIVWSILDRKRPNDRVAHAWLRLAVRYTLAFTLFTYGFVKVFPLQFQPAGFQKLTEPYGSFSPMGVLWSFMGASQPYTIFAGLCEVSGGVLLLFRRTTTLGSLVAFGVLLNVAMLNYCYDVPVKLYSTNLVLMALFLAAPEARRLLNFLVLNRPAEAADLSAPRFRRRSMRIAATVFQIFFVGYFLYSEISSGWSGYQESYVRPARPPLYGLWQVEGFTRNGQDVPPLQTAKDRWKNVAIQYPTFLSMRLMDDSAINYRAQYDANKNLLTLVSNSDKKESGTLAYTQPDNDHVALQGRIGNDDFSIRLLKIDTGKLLLKSRGYHWINEFPFNR